MLKKPKTHKGFSIVEIVIAILIISVLAVAVFAGGSTVVRNAKKSKTQSDLHNFAIATETWMNNNPSIAKAKNNSKYKLDTTLYNKFNELLDDDYKLEPVSGNSMVEITQDAEDTGDYYIFQSRKKDAWDKPYYVVFSNQNRNNLTGEKHSEFYVEVISAGANGKAAIGGSSDVIDKDDIFLVGQYDNDAVISHVFTYEDEQPGNYLAVMATSYTNIETAPTNIGVVRIKGSPATNAPTPDGPGSGIACPACGTIYASETDAPAHSINNSAASNAATWKAVGNSCVRTCDGCGKTLTTGFHSYGNYTAGNPKTDATHTLSRTCSKCDYIDTSLENHTFNSGTIVGNNRVFTCTKCGYVKTVENSATCPVCSTVYSSSSAAPAGSINYSATSTTWSDNGSTCREICGGCGKSLSTSSHTYGPSSIGNPKTETYHTVIKECTRCGHNDSSTENHTFNNGVISGNNIAYTCTQCEYIKNVAITAPTAKALTYNGTTNDDGTSQILLNAGSVPDGTMQYSLSNNSGWSTTIPDGTNAGSYTVYYRVLYNDKATAAQSINVTIARKGISRVTGTTTLFTYDGSAKTVVVNGYDEDTMTRSGTSSATNAGNYTAAYTPKSNFQWSSGSDVTETTFVAWTVSKADPTYTAPTSKSLTYNGTTNTNGTEQALINAGSATGGTMQYSTDNSNWSTTIPTGTNAGSYTVYYRVVGDSNHNDVAAQSINVTIARKGIERITGTTTSFTYDGSAKTVVVNGYDENTMTRGGTYSATDAGNYTATYTPKSNFQWNSGSNTTSAISIDWEIEQQITLADILSEASVGDTLSFGTMSVTKNGVTTALTMPSKPVYNGNLYSYTASDQAGNIKYYYYATSITFGDSVDGKKLNWVKASDTLYICDRNLWNFISYNDLDALGYGETDNTVVTIDGQTFKVRLLTSDEWDTYISPNTTNGSPYYWSNCYSWTSTHNPYQVICGYNSSDNRSGNSPSTRNSNYGFRPALEWIPNALKFSSPETFTLGINNNEPGWDGTLEYSTDLANWATWNGTSVISSSNSGDTRTLYLRGINNTKITGDKDGDNRFVLTGSNISCSGNIENLLDYSTVANGEHPEMADSVCYAGLFKYCESLVSAPDLPAVNLKNRCYQTMFKGCTSLTTAPELPATTLAKSCYSGMFSGCTSLISAPELPATTLAEYCYDAMFNGCTGLTTVPELPATTLAEYCYEYMFNGCTGLTTAPALPATTLADGCYSHMFKGCTGLTTAPELPATTLANYCYEFMFNGCAGLTTAPALPATTLASNCYYYMFSGCTGLTTAPELPATTLANYCYQCMFYGCTDLTTAPELPARTLAHSCYSNMFEDCTSLTTAPELPATTLANYCYYFMFYGCTSLTTAPELPATTLASGCYSYMFYDCTLIKLSATQTGNYQIPYRVPTTGSGTTATDALWYMFASTGGTFTDTPDINTTYYLWCEGHGTDTDGDNICDNCGQYILYGIEDINTVGAGSVFSFGTMSVTKDGVTTALTMPTNPEYDGDLYSYDGSSSGSNVTTYSNPTSITFGNAEEGKELKWVKASDTLYICDRNLWNYISYNNLDTLGYGETDNTVVIIDGQTFKVRLLTTDEWTSYVKPNTTNGSPYYWENCYSWTSTLYEDGYDSFCMIRGYNSSGDWSSNGPYSRFPSIGFRPALELVN